jgi:hypothetical protein
MGRSSRLVLNFLAALMGVTATVALATAPASAGSGGFSTDSGSQNSDDKVDPSAISGVPRPYAKFTSILSGRTGLSPRVVAAWTLAEGGPKDNPLNMGPGNRYGTVRKGARATEKNLRNEMYRDVLRSANRADRAQIDAIVDSPWCYRCKGYRRLLRNTYRQVRVDN